VTASEEPARPAGDRASPDQTRADRERGRPATGAPLSDQGDAAATDGDEDGDIAPEHQRLTVADDPIDKPAEQDSRYA